MASKRVYFVYYFITLIIATTMVIGKANLNNFNCTKDTDDYKCRLTTMTPYRFIANYDDNELTFPDCQAIKIWKIIRHGTRLPGKKVLTLMKDLPDVRNEIVANCEANNCDLSKATISRLKNWKFKLTDKDAMRLAEEGEDELIGLAERYQSRFPKLMPEKFNNETFKFKFTDKQRTFESFKHFAIGLFGKKASKEVWYPKPEKKDPILRFYKGCDKWKQHLDNESLAYKEFNEFKNRKIVKTMIEKLSQRLYIDASWVTVQSIYYMCAFEIAWKKKNISPWCDLLTPQDFEILEFAADLKYYYKDGYGHELNYKQACTALVDVFDFFKDENSDSKTSAYFTHSGTLLKILSLMNIAKDQSPLLHDSYSISKSRNWRMTLIDAFATNLAFVLYECKTGPCILVLHQERIVNFPDCPKNLPCPLEVMKKKFPHTSEQCLFKKMCSING